MACCHAFGGGEVLRRAPWSFAGEKVSCLEQVLDSDLLLTGITIDVDVASKHLHVIVMQRMCHSLRVLAAPSNYIMQLIVALLVHFAYQYAAHVTGHV